MKRLTFHLIPHTHWDREWYLPRAAFQARLIPVLDDVLAQLEGSAEARFVLDGQTVLLEDYLAIRPENEPRLTALVQRGALEIGPWYVLSDLLIPSRESLRRNLAEGARDAARFGRRLEVLYSPDAFGHPAGLPALAREFGLRWGVVRRGIGRPLGGDRDLYRWEAAGGESLLVYHLPAAGYDIAAELLEDDAALEQRWPPIRRELVERAVTDEVAVFLGADHHAMARNVSGLCARLQALEPRHEVRVSGLTEYFEAVERARPNPPVIRGELRRGDGHTWVLQGVHATRSRMKRQCGSAELLLARIAEPLARLAAGRGGTSQDGLLRTAWRTLLQSQFHDTQAGTTSDAVQHEQQLRLDSVVALSRQIATWSLWTLAGHDADRARERPTEVKPRLALWNPVQRSRSGIVTAELSFFRRDVLVGPPAPGQPRRGKGYQPFVLATPTGALIPIQVLAVRRDQDRLEAVRHYPDQDEVDRVWVAFRAPQLAGLGMGLLTPRPGRRVPTGAGLAAGNGFLANRFVELHISPTGAFTLTDKRRGTQYRDLCELVDEPDRGDLYTFSRGRGRAVSGGTPVSQKTFAPGPLVGAIETLWTSPSAGRGEISGRLVVALLADSPIIRLRLELDNRASAHRLRARFPLGAPGEALTGTAFGAERRAPLREPPRTNGLEQEVPTAPAQRFVAVRSGARGLVFLAPGFFEQEWSAAGELYVTVLRSVGELSRDTLPERPGHAGWPVPTPGAEEPGLHRLELALAPLSNAKADQPDRLERLWEEAFLPPQAYFIRDFCRTTPTAAQR